jgi:hypothetical protein
MLVAMIAALVVPPAALAVALDASKFGDLIEEGDKCPNGAFYHFVNNQTRGASAGQLTAQFSNGPYGPVGPYQMSGPNVQHFSAFSTGKLLGARSTLPGKLVLSGIACKKG